MQHAPSPWLTLTPWLFGGLSLLALGLLARRRSSPFAPIDPDLGIVNGGGGTSPPPPDPAKQLVRVEGYGGRWVRLRGDVAAALARLQQEARAAGFAAPLFLPVSDYRTRAEQEDLWTHAVARHGADKASRYVAHPGSSAHETGRAADLWLGLPIDSDNQEALLKTAAFQWLKANGERLGWYNYEAEAWHWEAFKKHDPTGATYRAEIAQGAKEGWLR